MWGGCREGTRLWGWRIQWQFKGEKREIFSKPLFLIYSTPETSLILASMVSISSKQNGVISTALAVLFTLVDSGIDVLLLLVVP